MIGVHQEVVAILNGQRAVSQVAYKEAYAFSVACLADPEAASKLDGYDDIKVREGAGACYRPFAYLLEQTSKLLPNGDDITANSTYKHRRSLWAKVFDDAYNSGVSVDDFIDVLIANGGVRKWYTTLCNVEKAKKAADPRVSTADAIQGALEKGGVEFLPEQNGKGVGVRMVKE